MKVDPHVANGVKQLIVSWNRGSWEHDSLSTGGSNAMRFAIAHTCRG